MAPRGETKRRILDTAAELFRRRGYHGTGLNLVLEQSAAPRGSLYFHFPEGKEQLGSEAVASAGGQIGAGIEATLVHSDDVAQAVGRIVDFLAADLRDSGFERGCPVGTVALDGAAASERVRLACEEAFEGWERHIARHLREAGWTRNDAAQQATLTVAAIEGALLLARTRRDTAPLDAVSAQLRKALGRKPPTRRKKR